MHAAAAAHGADHQQKQWQHLTGTAAFGPLTLSVGPGVFIPRPETEAILEWAVAQTLPVKPVVVDVCTGSGALALALAQHWPDARVIGLDDSDAALDYARRNAAGTRVEFVSWMARSISWCPTRPTCRMAQSSNPKWSTTIRHTPCSGARTAWR